MMTKQKVAKFISIVTLVPVIAFCTITCLYICYNKLFESIYWYIISILFLTVLPILAYPLKNLIPYFGKMGRDGERKLAFIMGVVGYIFGTILCFIHNAPNIVLKIFLSYLYSGVVLSFINKIVKVKASGHACGVAGPLTILLYYFGFTHVWWLYFIIPVVFWARINLGRHTYKELTVGTLVGIGATSIALFAF